MALRFPYRLAAAAALGLSAVAVAAEPAKPAQVSFHSDQQLADTLAGKLAQSSALSGYQVDVSCSAGTVEITGSVRNDEQRAEVMKTIRGTTGVKKIIDKLSIRNDVQTVQATEPTPASIGQSLPGTGAPPMQFQGQGMMMPGGPGGPGGYAPGGFGPGGPPAAGPMQGGPGGGGYGTDPTPMMVPPTGGMYDSSAPRMPPYAWPTYAPYNNYSRVGYPTEYPQNAFPFIGPFYPFPKVPLGYRAIKLEWEDGHWFYGRNGTMRDHWKVRYW